jgi:altronate dehydratase large subunit
MKAPRGHRRPGGRFGVRNHLLILPSVVCSTHVAGQIAAAADGVGVVHQHGCLQVGDDLRHSERLLTGVAVNPNVGAVLVVSLGCETLRGKALAAAIGERGQTVELVGIQADGGTAAAVEHGREAAGRMAAELLRREPSELDREELTVGLDLPGGDAEAKAIEAAFDAAGIATVQPPAGIEGPEAHVELAAAGAVVIVSRPPAEEAPMGFAVAPVVAVGHGSELHEAIAEDFDVSPVAGEEPGALAHRVLAATLDHAAGEPTAAESRGSREFVLRRLAVTM